jgi:chromosome segregation ATPase
MSADRSAPYCPACGLTKPCATCGTPRLGVVPDSIQAAGDAIAEAMAEISKARAGLAKVQAEKVELQNALSIVSQQLATSMKLEGEAEARTEKANDRITELETELHAYRAQRGRS